MGQTRAAVVQFMSTKSCFMNIPINWRYSPQSEQIIIFELKYGDGNVAYFSWSGNNVLKKDFPTNDVIEINSTYANKLGINYGEEVVVTEMLSVPSCHQVWMEPISDDDYEILELNVDVVKWQLLNQIRVVWKGQVLPVWVNKIVFITLIVTELSSQSHLGKLEQFSEVYIKPKFRVSGLTFSSSSQSSKSILCGSRASLKVSSGDSLIKPKSIREDFLQGSSDYQSSFGSLQTFYYETSTETVDSESEVPTLLQKISQYVFGSDRLSSNAANSVEELKSKSLMKNYWNADLKFNALLRVSPLPNFEHKSLSSSEITIYSSCCNVQNDNLAKEAHSICLLTSQPTTVFISSRNLSISLIKSMSSPVFLGTICKILSPSEKADITNKANNQSANKGFLTVTKSDFITDSVFVKVVVIDRLRIHCLKSCNKIKTALLEYLRPGRIVVPDSIRRCLKLESGSKVLLRSRHPDFEKINKISSFLITDMPNDPVATKWPEALFTTLNSYTDETCPLIINSDMLTTVNIAGNERDVLISPLESQRSEDKPCLLFSLSSPKQIIVEKLKNSSDYELVSGSQLDLQPVGMKSYALGGMDEIIEDGLEYLKVALNLSLIVDGIAEDGITCSGSLPGALAIVGPRGSGKSTLAKCLCRELSESPHFVHIEVIECKQLRGKRPDTMYKLWKKAFNQAVHKAPSIIVFDDLDHVAGFSSVERTAVDVVQEQVAQVIADFWKTITPPNHPVAFLMTCISTESLSSILFSARGCHIIQKFLTIPALNLEKRKEIVQSLLSSRCSNDSMEQLNLTKLLSKVEGATVQDLKTLVDKVVYSACRKANSSFHSSANDIMVTKEDFVWAIEGFVPSNLKDIKKTEIKKGWKDIGGLKNIKKTLEKTFLWPTKYPHLFAQCPLRLSSGLLLYGPPGTGKTLLAAAVASECSLNFISIKGPELLSKYIGASEQAVRDLFRKAEGAKPALLFFDEFDAIAPRRGHDSTGVTDRVVNQLLTQMDGIEERTDVFILAATSRPDLIDPALLRPGRLDKCLHCPLPKKEEQLEILQVLSRPLTLASDVCLADLVKFCEYFSGADLQALLFNAQLLAIHDEENSINNKDVPVKVAPDENNIEKLTAELDKKTGALSWVYMSNLEEGPIDVMPPEQKESLQVEIETIVSNNMLCTGSSASSCHIVKLTSTHSKCYADSSLVAVVKQAHLMKAVQEMKPSVSLEERERYRTIYETFVRSRSADFTPVVQSTVKKATLA